MNLGAEMDEKILHHKFVKLGNNRRRLTNELLALLPEIYEREIYRKYAKTIEEYAGKFGGLSRGVVSKRLRLEKYVKDKPELRDAIRTEGVHKVALIASLATMENDGFLADKVKNMSKPALQELSKELRSKQEGNAIATFCKAVPIKITIELDEEMSFSFLKLKQKFTRQISSNVQHLSNKEAMKIMMRQLLQTDQKVIPGDSSIKAEQNLHSECDKQKIQTNSKIKVKTKTVKSRYVSIHLRRNFLNQTADRCAYPNCNKPAEVFHHTERFAESKNHDSIKPLCKIHHEFMHNGLVMNQTKNQSDWQLGLNGKLTYSDHFYRHFRKT